MAWFPFTGWNKSFFGDLHIQGTEAIQFYTQQKMTTTRWFETAAESHHDPVWSLKSQQHHGLFRGIEPRIDFLPAAGFAFALWASMFSILYHDQNPRE